MKKTKGIRVKKIEKRKKRLVHMYVYEEKRMETEERRKRTAEI